jgi:DNA-3-methyladenine glycosylase
LLSGPGKLAQAFGITRLENGLNLLDPSSILHLLPRQRDVRVITGPRVGIAEGKGHDLPWRYMDADALEWVSRPRPSYKM